MRLEISPHRAHPGTSNPRQACLLCWRVVCYCPAVAVAWWHPYVLVVPPVVWCAGCWAADRDREAPRCAMPPAVAAAQKWRGGWVWRWPSGPCWIGLVSTPRGSFPGAPWWLTGLRPRFAWLDGPSVREAACAFGWGVGVAVCGPQPRRRRSPRRSLNPSSETTGGVGCFYAPALSPPCPDRCRLRYLLLPQKSPGHHY